MKGGFHGLRGKQVSLTLIALICMTILLWAWEKTPVLTSFLPPQNGGLMPDILNSEPRIELRSSKPNINLEEHISEVVPEGDRRSEQPEKSYDAPIVSDSENIPEISTDERQSTASLIEKKELLMDLQVKETRPKQDLKEETRLKQDLKEETRSEPVENYFNVTAPVDSTILTNSKPGKSDKSSTTTAEKKVCNYGKGKWIEDSRHPLYSGFECKQWLSEMWACRLTQRTDFTYERFRWKPHDCEMPEFEGSSFLRRMQDKTIALVGDSLGRQQFQSLMCMVTAGKETGDILDVGREYGLVKARGHSRPDGWAFRFRSTNTTILYYWSASLCELGPINVSDPATDWAMHLDRPAGFLQRYLDRFDVLVLNTGHHWNRGKLRANRWVMHVNGVPNTDRKIAEIGRAKNLTIYSVVKWLDLQLPKHPRLKAFFRTISPRHFFNGDWNSGGSCDNTTPLAGGKEVLQDESSDISVAGAVKGTRVKILDITAFSQLRDEGHISRYSIKATPGVQDCLHWCLPGVPDTWNEVLAAQI